MKVIQEALVIERLGQAVFDLHPVRRHFVLNGWHEHQDRRHLAATVTDARVLDKTLAIDVRGHEVDDEGMGQFILVQPSLNLAVVVSDFDDISRALK